MGELLLIPNTLPLIMKKILQILIILFSSGIFACVCDTPSITEKYSRSDFVAKAKIIKNYKNDSEIELYRADIVITELYKGDSLKSIYVRGVVEDDIYEVVGSSCAISIPEDTELIIYAEKNRDGKYTIGMCSGLMYLDYSAHYRKKTLKNEYELKKQKREIDILNTFKEKGIHYTSKIIYREKPTLHKNLEQFKGIELKKTYGIYEITFEADLTIINVSEISGFGNPIDQKLIEIIKKTEWTSYNKEIKDKVPDNSKLLIGIYYYDDEKDYSSFLSQSYL